MAATLVGCRPGDPGANGESHAEARAQAATCASLLERHTDRAVAPIDPAPFEAAMRDPRLADRSTTPVFLDVCGLIAKRRGLEPPR